MLKMTVGETIYDDIPTDTTRSCHANGSAWGLSVTSHALINLPSVP